jgi:NTE family protein
MAGQNWDDVGFPVKSLGKIIRSVQAFGRGLSGFSSPQAPHSAEVGIGLALGGGFARGIAHVGVLKVLEEENIPIRYIAGTSVGALIGAAYCSGISAAELEQVASRVRFKHIAKWTLSRYGFASNQRMIGFLSQLLKVKTFEELRIPLAVTATDFSTGEGVVFHSGPLIDPVRASCAYPGMFLPVDIGGRLLVDGMLAHAVPTRPLRQMGAERVLAIHLKAMWSRPEGPRHVFDVIGQCFAIAQDMNCASWRNAADLVIEPNVSGYEYDDFEHCDDLMRAGEAAMREALPLVRKWFVTAPDVAAARYSRKPARVTQPAPLPAD